jgi:ATP-dependent helicase HepA
MAAIPNSAPSAMGLLVAHPTLGYGKIAAVGSGRLLVVFGAEGKQAYFALSSLQDGVLRRLVLGLDEPARGPHGPCTVTSAPPPGAVRGWSSLEYGVTYTDGLRATVSEVDLSPLGSNSRKTLVGALAACQAHRFAEFSARERLIRAMDRMRQQVGGLRALLSSRFDLRPHQAFVAGTVILDHHRRYILADEVGLGKTIEAGIVIHDLLAARPDARILVVAPGALVRQWLCELHTGFGGQGFRLLDLHPPEAIDLANWTKVICSTDFALRGLDRDLLAQRWDMLVVDEAHHLLRQQLMYGFVQSLAVQARDLLLLSAVPARRRETELFRLLALLEPDRFRTGTAAEAEFLALYTAQEAIGRRLTRLTAEIEAVEAQQAEPSDAIVMARRLGQLPALAADAHIVALLERGEADPSQTLDCAKAIWRHVVDEYRINRRILRNRRQRLLAQEQIAEIRRRLEEHPYEPDSLEQEAVDAVRALLAELVATCLSPDFSRPLTRILLQSTCDPAALVEVLEALADPPPGRVDALGIELLGASGGGSYDRWQDMLGILAAGVNPRIPQPALSLALRRARAWKASPDSNSRLAHVAGLLRSWQPSRPKVLVFAGFSGAAARVATQLQAALGEQAVAEFRFDLPDHEKEEAARRFRMDPATWVLVSDETGGEGRNFQFADRLLHYDLPWLADLVEQRIGRLDRLGREAFSTEVPAHVVHNPTAPEAGLLACYRDGFGVFAASISGLEFALRDMHDRMADTAARGGVEGLEALAPSLAEAAREERLRDESEALLDEGSFQSAGVERFCKQPDPTLEKELEEAFVTFYRLAGRARAVREVRDERDERTREGLWRFRPDEVRDGPLAIVDRDGQGELNARTGTFRRETARLRRDVEFFTWGNPLFDALDAALTSRPTGRTYAIEVRATGVSPMLGLEAIVKLRPDLSRLADQPGLQELARGLLGVRRRSFHYALGPGQDARVIDRVRRSIRPEHLGRVCRDLSAERLHAVVAATGLAWPEFVAGCEAGALAAAERAFRAELDQLVAAERRRINEMRARARGAAGVDDASLLDLYLAALENWSPVVDSLGVMAINWAPT